MQISTKKIILLSFITILGLTVLFNAHQDIPLEKLKDLYTNEQSQFLDLNKMQVHYRDEGANTDSTPIVLIHGTAASLHTWDDWTEVLIDKGKRVIRMDLPAFGLTGPHPQHDYSIEAYAQFIHDFLQELELEHYHLVGNSLGGYIAWYYAAQYSTEVARLILIDPSGYPSEKPDPYIFRLARTPVLNQAFLWITPKFLIKNNLKQVYFDDDKVSPELVTRYHQMALRKGNRKAFIERSKTPFVDHSGLLEKIQTPTLLIWGEDDLWIPASLGTKYVAAMPNARLKIMPKVGHVPMEEEAEASADLLLDFLKEEIKK